MQTYKLLADDVTITAGSTFTSVKWKVPGAAGGILLLKLTNSSTAPTTPARVKVYYSYDESDTNKYLQEIIIGTTEDAGSEEYNAVVDKGIPWVWIVAGDNTDQPVTLRAEAISFYGV